MKKILFLSALIMLLTANIYAQSFSLLSSGGSFTTGSNPYSTVIDTVEDSETGEFTVSIPNDRSSLAFQLIMKDISGDPSGVVVNWYEAVDVSAEVYATTPKWSDTMPNSDFSIIHAITGNPIGNYKMEIIGTGTHESSYQIILRVR